MGIYKNEIIEKRVCIIDLIDLYYIKETNRFNLAYLADWIYYTCLGTEGLKSFLTVFFKKI